MSLPEEICNQICVKMVLGSWVHERELRTEIYKNPNALDYITDKISKNETVYWGEISENPNPDIVKLTRKDIKNRGCGFWNGLSTNSCSEALEILKENPEKISYFWLSKNTNPVAIKMLREMAKLCSSQINWISLCENPGAVEILDENKDRIIWTNICRNKNSRALQLVLDNVPLENLYWSFLSSNPNAMELLKKNPDKIDWCSFCGNPHPEAIQIIREKIKVIPEKISGWYLAYNSNPEIIQILEDFPDKISPVLSMRSEAIPLLKKYPEKIRWEYMGANPAIFEPGRNEELFTFLMSL